MKVVVDLLFIIPSKNRGSQTYVDSLLPHMVALPGVDIVCLTNRTNHRYYQTGLGFECHLAPVGGLNRLHRLVYQQVLMSSAAKRLGADVLYCPGGLSPVRPSIPTVLVMHDVNFRDIPGSVAAGNRIAYNLILPRAIRAASQVVTVSQFSRERILAELSGVRKPVVIHEGPLTNSKTADEVEWTVVKEKYGITGECFLSISSGLPHKNIGRLVRGFVEMKKRFPGEWQLALVGHDLSDEVRAYLSQEGFIGSVIATGFVSDVEKVAFLRNSFAYFFPSLYEGFGLPALEAQSCGLPLAASRFGSLPEVCGQGATYFDAKSVESIADTFQELCQNADLRKRLIKAGYENLSRFSWSRAAEQTMDVLSNAANENRRVAGGRS